METEEIKRLIKLNRIQEAIKVLEDVVPKDDNRLFVISSKYRRIAEKEIKGTASFDELERHKNKINDGLLDLIDNVARKGQKPTDNQRKELLTSLLERYEKRKIQKLNPSPRLYLKASIEYNSEGVSETIKEDVLLIKENRKTNFDQLFDDFYNSLKRVAIIGPSGSGKTFLAIDFAIKLVNIAYANENFPIPVILDASSWRANESFKDWLQKVLPYSSGSARISREYAKELIEKNAILPILDDFSAMPIEGLEEKIYLLKKYAVETRNKRNTKNTYPELIVTCLEDKAYFSNLETYAYVRLKKMQSSDIGKILEPFVHENDIAAKKLYNYIADGHLENNSIQTVFHLKLVLMLLESSKGTQILHSNGTKSIDIAVSQHINNEIENIRFSTKFKKAKRYLSWLAFFLTKKNGKNPSFELTSLQPKSLAKKDLWKFRAIYGLLTGFSFAFPCLFVITIIDYFFNEDSSRIISQYSLIVIVITFFVIAAISALLAGVLLGFRDDLSKAIKPKTNKKKISIGIRNAVIALIVVVITEVISGFFLKNIIENYVLFPALVFLITLAYYFFKEKVISRKSNFYSIQVEEIYKWSPTLRIDYDRMYKNFGNVLAGSLLFSNVFGFVCYLFLYMAGNDVEEVDLSSIWISSMMFGIIAGIVIGFMVGIIKSQFYPVSIPKISNAYTRFFSSIRFNFIIMFFSFSLTIFIVYGMTLEALDIVTYLLFIFGIGIPVSILYSFNSFLKHIALRITLYLKGVLPLKLVSFLNQTLRYSGLIEKDGGRWRFQHGLVQEQLYDGQEMKENMD